MMVMGASRETWLIEILLPLTYNDGSPVSGGILSEVRKALLDHFGGLTAFTRSPAEGAWISGEASHHDDIVVLEVMADNLDRAWWKTWRERAEILLGQEEIVVRGRRVERL